MREDVISLIVGNFIYSFVFLKKGLFKFVYTSRAVPYVHSKFAGEDG